MRSPKCLPCCLLRGMLLSAVALCAVRCGVGNWGYVTPANQSTAGQTGGTGGQSAGTSGTTTDGGITGTQTGDVPGVAADNDSIGIRLASGGAAAGLHPVDDVFWLNTINTLSQNASGSTPAATLVVGLDQNGNCVVRVPATNNVVTSDSSIVLTQDTSFDNLLTKLDGINARVVLEVQPGKAGLSNLANLVINAYGSHASVVGLGVDVQYKGTTSFSSSAYISKSDIKTLVSAIQSINPNLMLYVRAADADNISIDASTTDVVFVHDGKGYASSEDMVAALKAWASAFAPSPVQLTIGSPNDANWWCGADAASITSTLFNAALATGSNITGVLWQADGIVLVYPTIACMPAPTTTGTGSTSTTGSSTSTGSSTGTGSTSATGSTSGTSAATTGSGTGSTTATGTTSATSGSTSAQTSGTGSTSSTGGTTGTGSSTASQTTSTSGASTGSTAGGTTGTSSGSATAGGVTGDGSS